VTSQPQPCSNRGQVLRLGFSVAILHLFLHPTTGLFTLLVRCLVGAVFLSKMKDTISNCASPHREPFLRAFAVAGACFFFALPFIALLLFLFANNCSIARNLTLIAGLSQVCASTPSRSVALHGALNPCPSCSVSLALASSYGPNRTTLTWLSTTRRTTHTTGFRCPAFECNAVNCLENSNATTVRAWCKGHALAMCAVVWSFSMLIYKLLPRRTTFTALPTTRRPAQCRAFTSCAQ
jgi:hypothetical protein